MNFHIFKLNYKDVYGSETDFLRYIHFSSDFDRSIVLESKPCVKPRGFLFPKHSQKQEVLRLWFCLNLHVLQTTSFIDTLYSLLQCLYQS